MTRPLVGIVGNYYLINDEYPVSFWEMNIDAVSTVCDAIAMVIESSTNATSEG